MDGKGLTLDIDLITVTTLMLESENYPTVLRLDLCKRFYRRGELFNHRIEGYVEEDIPRHNDLTFRAHFRLQLLKRKTSRYN